MDYAALNNPSFSNNENPSNTADAFNSLDLNGDGVISVNELKSTLDKNGFKKPSIQNVPDVLKAISKDGKEVINYDEFKSVFKNK